MNKYLPLLIVAAIIIAAGIAFGYYVGYDIGWEKAVPTAQKSQNTNSQMLADKESPYVTTQDVVYFENTTGYFAQPATLRGSYPGVVMIHEWWGLNDNIKDMARELASEGYNVLAVDLFGKVATTADEARAQTGSLDKEKAIQNLRAAITYLRTAGSRRIASLGWCFGGGQSLQLALSGEQLDATVIYYGQLVTDQQKLAAIDWPVLGVFGDKDTSIPVDTVNQFDAGLDALGVKNEVYIYPSVGHAFANPSGANYAATETADAWVKTLDFLNKALQN